MRPALLFLTHSYTLNRGDLELFSLADEVGFHVFVVPWFCVNVNQGSTYVCGGFEVLSNGAKRPIVRWEEMSPKLIFHRLNISAAREELFNRLAQAHPDALLSYCYPLKFLTSRWEGELCLRRGESWGINVPRPKTFLVPNELTSELRNMNEHLPLVFSRADGSPGREFVVTDPGVLEAVLHRLTYQYTGRFVIQKVEKDEVILNKKAFRVRLYALVNSFHPLRYSVFYNGVAKASAVPQELKSHDELQNLFTSQALSRNGRQSDENIPLEQLLERLRGKGLWVDDFEDQVDHMVRSLFTCFANWGSLAMHPDIGRVFLITALEIMLMQREGSVVPLFLESHCTPLLHQLGPHEVDVSLLGTTRSWLTQLFERCHEPQSILLPAPDFDRAFPPIDEVVGKIQTSHDAPIVLRGAASILSHVDARQKLLERVGSRLPEGVPVRLRATDDRLEGVELTIHRNGHGTVLDFDFENDAAVGFLKPPLAHLFPTVGNDYCMVDTKPWPDARFLYLDPNTVGPRFGSTEATREESLLQYLGRVITDQPSTDLVGKRFVEPGIGRTCLIDFLRIDGCPHLSDFSVLGIGLTPYSEHGYAMVGPYVDGLTSAQRAAHRHKCAERLEAAGCRVAKTVAIIALPGLETTMPDETNAPAALIVRGFRSVLRVKQLDPLACLFMSTRHRPNLFSFLLDPRWEVNHSNGNQHARTITREAAWEQPLDYHLLQGLRRFGGGTSCLRRIVGSGSQLREETPSIQRARERRLQVIYSYAPMLLEKAKDKLARELGRDPDTEPLSDQEYVAWFGENLGAQLALMKRVRFLHDYHQEGIKRHTPQWIYTLCETNVTLLAEFPDLDTGIFTDRLDTDTLDELLLTKDEFDILRDGYDKFHKKDVEEAMMVLRTLSLIIFHGDRTKAAWAMEQFNRGYQAAASPIVAVSESGTAKSP
jgi:hypothetical protein